MAAARAASKRSASTSRSATRTAVGAAAAAEEAEEAAVAMDWTPAADGRHRQRPGPCRKPMALCPFPRCSGMPSRDPLAGDDLLHVRLLLYDHMTIDRTWNARNVRS